MDNTTKYTAVIKLRVELSRVRRLLDTILASATNNGLLDEYNLSYEVNTSYNRLHSAEKALRNKISELDKEIKNAR